MTTYKKICQVCRVFRPGLLVGVMLLGLTLPQTVTATGTPEEREFEYRDLRSLEINAAIFEIEVRGGSGNRVEVGVYNIPQGFNVQDRVRRGAALINIKGRNTWFSRQTGTPSISVTVPTGIQLDIETASGSIVITGVSGEIRLRSASGSVDATSVGGEVAVHTASGAVALRDTTGTLEISTASGRVDVKECRGVLDISTASGRVRLDEVELTSSARIRTSSGAISLGLRNDLRDVRYSLSSASGRIQFGDISAERSLSGGNGRFGVEARSASGSISVFPTP